MTNRHLLHKTKLEAFKVWLDDQNIAHRPGRGDWQALQVHHPLHGWQVLYERAEMPEHLTVAQKLVGLVWQFIRGTREC